MLVRDCMTPHPTTIDPEATLEDALGFMRALRVRHLPVLSGATLVGILTWTDLMHAAPPTATPLNSPEFPALLARVHVKDTMVPEPITVAPDTPVEIAARILRERKIGSLPVIEDRMLVGIVTETDLFGALIHLLGGDLRGLRMAVELPNGLADLAVLVQTLRPLLDGGKGALTITARLDAISSRGYLRVSTGAPLALAEAVAVAGLEVSNLHFESPIKVTHAAV